MAERKNAGKQDQAGRLVRVEEFQIFQPALGIILGMPDQHAVAMGSRFVFKANQDAGEVRITDVGRDHEYHVRAPQPQAARHRVGGVARQRNGLIDLQPRGLGNLLRHVNGPRNCRDRHFGDPGDIFDGCGGGIGHSVGLGLCCETLHRLAWRSNAQAEKIVVQA
ncbi:hypothetical protein D9M72_416780 [compost metagenome]